MTPRLVATCFSNRTYDPHGQYPRLARVLAHTARAQCPGWIHQIEVVDPPPRVNVSTAFDANVHKMARWCAALEAAADGDAVLFLDVDMMIVRPLDPLWAEPFDLAYTVKHVPRYPFNTGTVAVRVSPAIRHFFGIWLAECRRMQPMAAAAHHHQWRRQFGGIHQAALGCIFAAGHDAGLAIRQLRCVEWNCEDSAWSMFDPTKTRIVHCKSALRAALFGIGPVISPSVARLVKIWRQLERDAVAAEACAS